MGEIERELQENEARIEVERRDKQVEDDGDRDWRDGAFREAATRNRLLGFECEVRRNYKKLRIFVCLIRRNVREKRDNGNWSRSK